jgi:thiol:disulfide interchange protein
MPTFVVARRCGMFRSGTQMAQKKYGVSMTKVFYGTLPLIIILFLLSPVSLSTASAGEVHEPRYADAKLFTRVTGSEVRAAIEIRIQPGWHLYHDDPGLDDSADMATTVTMGGKSIAWSKARFPNPQPLDSFGVLYNVHEGTIVIYVLGQLDKGASAGDITATVTGITCSDSCVPYEQTIKSGGTGPDVLFENFPGDLVVGEKEPPLPSAGIEIEKNASSYDEVTFPDFKPQGGLEAHWLGVWLLLAFVAGIILNVMPCVLPVVSIKIFSFVRQAQEGSRRVFMLGLAFAAGMILVFWVLAGVAITLGMGWGEQFESQAFMVALIAVVFAFALSLLDVYTFGIPRTVTALASGMQKEGLGNAFFEGMLATILATPCSGPFLGGTLAWTLKQPALTIFLIFTALGFGMAIPYVILTAFPTLLKIVPKSGAWMVTFKHVMGFVLLGTVVYLIFVLRRDLLPATNAFLMFVAVGCWCWGRFARPNQKFAKRFLVFGVTTIIIAGGAYFSFKSLRSIFAGKGIDTPGHSAQANFADGEQSERWRNFDAGLFKEYLSAGRTVLIDFTADWCPNCKYNEKMVYESDEIRTLIKRKNAVAFLADITHGSPRTEMLKRLRNKLGIYSIPLLAVFPGDRPCEPHLLPDIVTVKMVREILDACPKPAPVKRKRGND